MHSLSRVLCCGGFAIWIALAGCKAKDDNTPATREDCQKVSEHIADLVVERAKAQPEAFWDSLHEQPGPIDVPATVTKESFATWLESPEGQTFMMKRRGQTLAGTQQAVDTCIANARKKDVHCFLAAKTGEDVQACDKARAPKGSAQDSTAPASGGSSIGSGSAVGSASSSGSGSGSM